jgi:hypothetical protein
MPLSVGPAKRVPDDHGDYQQGDYYDRNDDELHGISPARRLTRPR